MEYKNIPYSNSGNPIQTLDLYLPDAGPCPLFIYFHGGGLESGDKSGYETELLQEFLLKRGIGVASVNYRMYPTAVYPQFIEDAAMAVHFLFTNIRQYADIHDFFIGGSSAGGYLSLMLCFDRQYLGKYGLDPMMIKGFIHDAGQPTKHFRVLKEMGMGTKRIVVDESAPLYHVGTSEKYPPMLFLVSDNDMSNRYDQTILMVSTLKEFGHTEDIELKIMHGGHCHYVAQGLSDEKGSVLSKIVCAYILSHTDRKIESQ